MAKQERRNWLAKISRWILSALPAEDSSESKSAAAASATIKKEQEEVLQRKKAANANTALNISPLEGNEASQREQSKQNKLENKAEELLRESPAVTQASDIASKTVAKAWKAFELAWSNAGLSNAYFYQQDDLKNILEQLDRSFEEELIEWLFQLCNKPDALRDLAGIIRRGQVKPNDNIDAIRAFAYVSVAVASNTRDSAVEKQLGSDSKREENEQQDTKIGRATNQITNATNTEIETQGETEIKPDKGQEVEARKEPGEIQGKITSADNEWRLTDDVPEELELSPERLTVKRANISTLVDLAGRTEADLLEIKNFGQKSAEEVRCNRKRVKPPLLRPTTQSRFHRKSTRTTNAEPRKAEGLEKEFDKLELSTRALNCLYRGKIDSIKALLYTESELLDPNPGTNDSRRNQCCTFKTRAGTAEESSQHQTKDENGQENSEEVETDGQACRTDKNNE